MNNRLATSEEKISEMEDKSLEISRVKLKKGKAWGKKVCIYMYHVCLTVII